MLIATRDLDQFVAHSDSLGGPSAPACAAYWAGLEYRPDTEVDETLDPFGPEYTAQQLAVYHEVSGRELDQLVNEHTVLDVAFHTAGANPYVNVGPGALALHIERLSRALKLAEPPAGSRLLDMGCGWGLSSELAAYCGLQVTAVDVNPDFVELVNRRAARFGHAIAAQHGMFDTFESDQRFETILFYECFHHALSAGDLAARMQRHLTPNGRIILAFEPINDEWWKHWGIRLDPLSVYCIRKFGWLENGWSENFLCAAFERAGLNVKIHAHVEAGVGTTVVASPSRSGRTSADDIGRFWRSSGWLHDGSYMICQQDSMLTLVPPAAATKVALGFQNFRGRPVQLEISKDGRQLFSQAMPAGRSVVDLDTATARGQLRISGEQWVPDHELHNGDARTLSLHLEDLIFS